VGSSRRPGRLNDAGFADPGRTTRAAGPAERSPGSPGRRKWLTGAFSLILTGLLALGTAGGYELATRHPARSLAIPDVPRPVANTGAGTSVSTIRMPDITGLPQTAALQAVGDAGYDPGKITVRKRVSAAPAGTVVAQDPVRGTTNPGRVVIDIAIAGRVPQLAGTPAAAAAAALTQLGALVVQHLIYAPGAAAGTVLASRPAAGASLAATVTLDVAALPSAIFLSDVNSQTSSCLTGTASSAGVSSDHTVSCQLSDQGPVGGTWLLGHHSQALSFTFGITDASPAGSHAHLVIKGDGNVLAAADVNFGAGKKLTAPMAGVAQLTIEMTGTAGATGVLLDPQLIGAPADINALGHP